MNAGVRKAFKQATLTIISTICLHRLVDAIITVRFQKEPHDVLYRRTNYRRQVRYLIRNMPQGAQSGLTARQNARLGIDQGAIEIEENGRGGLEHGPS